MSSGGAWLCALLVTVACSGGMPRPTAGDVARATGEWPSTTLANLEEGRAVYARRCGGCHKPHAPARFPEARWRGTMDDMALRSGLDSRERDGVLRYLVTLSRLRTTSPAP